MYVLTCTHFDANDWNLAYSTNGINWTGSEGGASVMTGRAWNGTTDLWISNGYK